MSRAKRVVLALGILVLDSAVFFIPLSALLLMFVVLVRPWWFLNVVLAVYRSGLDDKQGTR